jgi:hypothetical protein
LRSWCQGPFQEEGRRCSRGNRGKKKAIKDAVRTCTDGNRLKLCDRNIRDEPHSGHRMLWILFERHAGLEGVPNTIA